jgi:catechol 2,3-dioxygenase-like lactoylglutathione lyase family enzyme
MRQHLGLIAIVVHDYDKAISFYTDTLGFTLVDDRYDREQGKRWVVVSPTGSSGTNILLARASNEHQASRVGDQTGGRVFLFLYTDDFWRDFHAYKAKGVSFVREPKTESYGTVAVFEDLYGNQWDLVQPTEPPLHSLPKGPRRLTAGRSTRGGPANAV